MLHINADAIQSARCRDGPLAAAPPPPLPPLAATLPLAAAACRWHTLTCRHGGQNHHSRCRLPRLHRLPHRPAHADPGCAVSGKSGAGAGCGWSPTALAPAAASCGSNAFEVVASTAHYPLTWPLLPAAAGTASTLSVRRATSQAPTASASAATAPCCWVRCRWQLPLSALPLLWGLAKPYTLLFSWHQLNPLPAPLPPCQTPTADYSKREDLKWAADCWWDRDVIVYGDAGAAGCLSGGWLGQCCCLCTRVQAVLLSAGGAPVCCCCRLPCPMPRRSPEAKACCN